MIAVVPIGDVLMVMGIAALVAIGMAAIDWWFTRKNSGDEEE